MKAPIFSILAMFCVSYACLSQAMNNRINQKVLSFEQIKIKEQRLRKKKKEKEAIIINIPYQEWTDKEKERQALHQEQDEFAKIMQELERTTKDMDAFIKSLPAGEKEEFNKVVQQVEKKMLDMDPAVLEKFLTNQMSQQEQNTFLDNLFKKTNRVKPKAPPLEGVVIEQ
jgi:23S rRNA G2445 N2-methylase RlmL